MKHNVFKIKWMVPINIYRCWRSFWADKSIFYKLHLEIIYDNKKHQMSTLTYSYKEIIQERYAKLIKSQLPKCKGERIYISFVIYSLFKCMKHANDNMDLNLECTSKVQTLTD